MNRRTAFFAALAAALAGRRPASAQTKVQLANLQATAAPGGRAVVILPDGQFSTAILGPSIRLDLTTTPPTLSAIVPSLPADKLTRVKLPATGTPPVSVSILETPAAGTIPVITRNGVTLTEGDDYSTSADGRTFTFQPGQALANGDLVIVRYRA